MEKGNRYFIQCTEKDYPYVRDKLIEIGFREWTPIWCEGNAGVYVGRDCDFYPDKSDDILVTNSVNKMTLDQFKEL